MLGYPYPLLSGLFVPVDIATLQREVRAVRVDRNRPGVVLDAERDVVVVGMVAPGRFVDTAAILIVSSEFGSYCTRTGDTRCP
jgi:hypothetical protein